MFERRFPSLLLLPKKKKRTSQLPRFLTCDEIKVDENLPLQIATGYAPSVRLVELRA
jgi:hypothetical protein